MIHGVFRRVAGLRRARAFHPDGRMFGGRLVPWRSCPEWVPVREAAVRARLSRGVGLPVPLPDILGLAFRLPGPWDVLLSSSAAGVVPWFARSWRSARFSSVVRYRLAGHRFQLRARVLDGRPDRLPITVALSLGDGTPVARLVLDSIAPDDDTAFDPMLNRPGGLGMGPRWFARLRERAYDGSRTGRAGVGGQADHGV